MSTKLATRLENFDEDDEMDDVVAPLKTIKGIDLDDEMSNDDEQEDDMIDKPDFDDEDEEDSDEPSTEEDDEDED